MGGYIPQAQEEYLQMLGALGMSDERELFAEIDPALLCGPLRLPKGRGEMQLRRIIEGLAGKNTVFPTMFRGAGAYRHYIPAIVRQVAAKESFVTAYTPYQAEISQGILQIIYEYQSEICALTDMAVSNASIYDGASAAAEATSMCRERMRQTVLVAETSHPSVVATIKTYSRSADAPVKMIKSVGGLTDIEALRAQLAGDVACLYVASPNFNGQIEDVQQMARLCHEAGVKIIMGTNPIALALYKTPGEMGVDVAVGDGQPLGMPLSFGGPYLGYMAATQAMMRKLPGRIVGETRDADDKRCYVLTLQAREQHIRREKALSSVCTNQSLCALTATVYMAVMGPQGLADVAQQCNDKAHYAAEQLGEAGFARVHGGAFFHEFITQCPCDVEALMRALEDEGILGGLPVEEGILWCFTEMNTAKEIDQLVRICAEVAKK